LSRLIRSKKIKEEINKKAEGWRGRIEEIRKKNIEERCGEVRRIFRCRRNSVKIIRNRL
jgi:hypothetical protein